MVFLFIIDNLLSFGCTLHTDIVCTTIKTLSWAPEIQRMDKKDIVRHGANNKRDDKIKKKAEQRTQNLGKTPRSSTAGNNTSDTGIRQ